MRNVAYYAAWAARILLSVLFLYAASIKLWAAPESIATFERLGFGQWFRIAVGVLQIAGAIGLLITPISAIAALGLALLMIGAVVSTLTMLGESMVPALVALALCLFVVRVELPHFRVLVSGKGPMDGWIAYVYDRRIQTAFRDLFPELSADLLPRFRDARRVLDVGCGPGQFTIMIAEGLPQVEVCGIDVAPTMIELARAHATTSPAAGRLRFEVADVSALPFPDDTFDAIISSGSIKMWPDAVAGLREIHRVLAPAGRALVAEMNRTAPAYAVSAMVGRGGNWFARMVMPRVLRKSLSADEGAALFTATPFGRVTDRMLLLDGFLWMVEARKAA